MSILTVSAKDFCCFGEFNVNLHRRGLVWIGGKNQDTAAAKSNGCGKSSFFKAIGWGAYGQAIDGKDGDEVIRDGAACAIVELTYTGGWRSVRERRRGQPRLKLFAPDGATVPGSRDDLQAFIEDLLGVDWQSFRNTVLYGQRDRGRFLESGVSDRERKAILQGILRTNIYSLAQKPIQLQLRSHRAKLNDMQVELAGLEAALAEQDLPGIEAACEVWKEARDRRFKGAMQEALDILAEAREIKTSRPDLKNLEEELKEAYKSKEELKLISEKMDLLLKSIADKSNAISDARAGLRLASDKASRYRTSLADLSGDNCPTCKGELKSGLAASYIAGLQAKETEARALVVVKTNAVSELSSSLKSLELETEAVRSKRHSLRLVVDSIAELAGKAASARELGSRVKSLKAAALRAKANASSILHEKNPYSGKLKATQKRIEQLEAHIVLKRNSMLELQSDVAHCEFWNKGFGPSGIPSFVLDSIMPFIASRANHYLETLADGDISLEFSTQKELKSSKGEYRDEISASWTIEGVSDHPPSGGQWKKMEIATDLALMDLVATRERSNLDLLLLDEALDGVDSEGRARVLQLLHSLRSKRGSIFVISQDSDMAEIFERSMTVVKKGQRSAIV